MSEVPAAFSPRVWRCEFLWSPVSHWLLELGTEKAVCPSLSSETSLPSWQYPALRLDADCIHVSSPSVVCLNSTPWHLAPWHGPLLAAGSHSQQHPLAGRGQLPAPGICPPLSLLAGRPREEGSAEVPCPPPFPQNQLPAVFLQQASLKLQLSAVSS